MKVDFFFINCIVLVQSYPPFKAYSFCILQELIVAQEIGTEKWTNLSFNLSIQDLGTMK